MKSRQQQAKRATVAGRASALAIALAVWGAALPARAGDNYIIPGARQEGGNTAVVARAALTGSSGQGNPIVIPYVHIDTSGTGAAETDTAVSFTSGTNTIAAGAKAFELILTTTATANIISTGTLTVSGSTLVTFARRAAAGDTLPAYSVVIASGTLTGSVQR